MGIGMNIKDLREKAGLSQGELARILNVSDKTVSAWENGTRTPRMGAIQKLADYFHVQKSVLIEDQWPFDLPENAFPYNTPAMHRIPVLGTISAGLPIYAEQNIEGYTYTDLNGGAEYFALRVKGDSMTAARINPGDTLIVRRQDMVENGEIAVVLVGDEEATVKRFYRKDNVVTLIPQSNNPEHQPQIYNCRTTSIRILGKVVRNQFEF